MLFDSYSTSFPLALSHWRAFLASSALSLVQSHEGVSGRAKTELRKYFLFFHFPHKKFKRDCLIYKTRRTGAAAQKYARKFHGSAAPTT